MEEFCKQKLEKVKNINSFNDYGVKKLSENMLKSMTVENKRQFLERSDILSSYPDKFLIEFLTEYLQELRKKNKGATISTSILRSLTKSQLEKLGKEMEELKNSWDYMSIWFSQNFSDKLNKFGPHRDLTISEKQEKRAVLKDVKAALNKINTRISKSLEYDTFMEMLVLDISM